MIQCTFANIFKNDITDIEIPKIQRDYAQGRKDSKVDKIRDNFLTALYNSLHNKKPITLDFVYGSIVEDKNETKKLIPLDGQQRLTTLFLLHLFVAKKEKIDKSQYEFLNHFSYNTRFSSRDFCHCIIENTFDCENESIKKEIENQFWFQYEWKNDPTITSMLVMLDCIQQKLKTESNLWDLLVNTELISFYFISLDDMKMTDDLYVKMNSRGKPLTLFEHFKVEFEDIVEKNSKELRDEISKKIDIDWTDMLFNYRDENNIIDDKFLNYFKYISHILSYLSDIPLEWDEFVLAHELYSPKNTKAQENLEFLKKSLDCWCNINIEDFFKKYFVNSKYESNKVAIYQEELNLFKECCDDYANDKKFTLQQMLLLYAIIVYLQNKDKVREDQFIRNIRIIRNLIWNSSDEIREFDQNGDNQMKRLLQETKKIVLDGFTQDLKNRGFSAVQKREEQEKIEWSKSNSHLKENLFRLEDNPLLYGAISIIGLDKIQNGDKFNTLFENCSKKLICNSLLTKGDYSQLISWRYQIGGEKVSIWKDLFHQTKSRKYFENTSKILNSLLEDLQQNTINDEHLETIVANYFQDKNTKKDWRYYILKYELLSPYGMYFWLDKNNKNYNFFMMNTEKSRNGKHWNIFLYELQRKYPNFSISDYGTSDNTIYFNEIQLQCENDRFILINREQKTEIPIKQSNGIDIEDRIERGYKIIENLHLEENNKKSQ